MCNSLHCLAVVAATARGRVVSVRAASNRAASVSRLQGVLQEIMQCCRAWSWYLILQMTPAA